MSTAKPIVFFDLETGGLNRRCPIIQLAAVVVDDDFKPIDEFERKIKFDIQDCEDQALEMNCYSTHARLWDKAEPQTNVVQEFSEWLKGYRWVEFKSKRTQRPYTVAQLCAYNGVAFDMPRLRDMFFAEKESWMPSSLFCMDALQLVAWHFHGRRERPEDLKLQTVAAYFNVSSPGAHDALADCHTTIEVVKRISTCVPAVVAPMNEAAGVRG